MNKEFLIEIKNTFVYWAEQILEKGFYLLICIILSLIVLYANNPYGRYLDAWLE